MKIELKIISFFFAIIFLLSNCQKRDQSESASIDFDLSEFTYKNAELPDYFLIKSSILDSIREEPVESDKIAALGRILFYDKKLSLNNTVSCGTCHRQAQSFTDGKKSSLGLFADEIPRNSMTLANCGNQRTFFWENNRGTLEQNVLLPVSNHREMGMENMDVLVEKLTATDYYPELFKEAFGFDRIDSYFIGDALAEFLKSMYSYNSKYDKGLRTEFSNFTQTELRGKDLFLGKAGCANCHNEPFFINKWGGAINIGLDLEYADQGRGNGLFKVPTLRNIEVTAPYMHDGQFETLEEVVEHYNSGVKPHDYLNFYLRENFRRDTPPRKLNLTKREKEELVAFMKTLTDYEFMVDPKFSDPFN